MRKAFSEVKKINARRGADVLLEILCSEGVEYIFGNPGTTELPLMDALLRTPDLKYVLALQEATAVAMADGYAQTARRPGFLNLHTAGGLGHGMGNLLNASVSQTPLVVTAGQQDSRHTVTDPLLFGDLVRIAEPAVKWAREVASADQLPVLVRRAFHDASAAPTGPVFLSLPMDVMEEMSTVGIEGRSRIDRSAVGGSLERLAKYLADVAPGRLAIIAGDEIHASEAAEETVAVAQALGAPVMGHRGLLAFLSRRPTRFGPGIYQQRPATLLRSSQTMMPSLPWAENPWSPSFTRRARRSPQDATSSSYRQMCVISVGPM
jgi:benzoylformate decarboxylase